MAKFSRASQKSDEFQATQVAKALQGTHGSRTIKSDMSVEGHENRLKLAASYMRSAHNMALRDMTVIHAKLYLEQRAELAETKSTFNTDRGAVYAMLRNQGKLGPLEQISVRYERDEIMSSRSYTHTQIDRIRDRMTPKNALCVDIAHVAGVRAHELYTIDKLSNQPADIRPEHELKFQVKTDWERYSVNGKGGLVREIRLPPELAKRLESYRLPTSVQVRDRAVFYDKKYDLSGGKKFSNAFSAASKRTLGYSNGAHGIRHTYAKTELGRYQQRGVPFVDAKTIVSQELGHFRPDIVDAYLR
jgi:integrase